MVSQETARCRRSGRRDNEPIAGFESYHLVACKLARKLYRNWFPTDDDLSQAGALAAVEALAALGKETTLKPLCRLIDRVLYQQSCAYGLRYVTNHKAGTHHSIRREICFCQFTTDSGDNSYIMSSLEAHYGAVGVGQFTCRAAQALHRLVNLPDQTNNVTPGKAQLLERMHEVLDSSPELRTLREWYLGRSCYFGYEAMEREGLWHRTKGHRLMSKARLLAGVDCSPHDREMAQRVAEVYQAANDKRTRQLSQQLGMSKTSVQKWLMLARALGLLPPEKSFKHQVMEAHRAYPTASSRELGRIVGLSKSSVRRWLQIVQAEGYVA